MRQKRTQGGEKYLDGKPTSGRCRSWPRASCTPLGRSPESDLEPGELPNAHRALGSSRKNLWDRDAQEKEKNEAMAKEKDGTLKLREKV